MTRDQRERVLLAISQAEMCLEQWDGHLDSEGQAALRRALLLMTAPPLANRVCREGAA